MEIIQLESEEHGVERVKMGGTVQPLGARTKPWLAVQDKNVVGLDCRHLSGITEYEPTEFTFTAQSGTPLAEIQNTLAENGQYLPFDPPFANQGATIGGAIASGLNGSSSLRFGGLRDFMLGVSYIDGLGDIVASGGKVVKNAAGFDLSKFMVGSCGQFGILTQVTLKVFPRPESFATLEFDADLDSALSWIKRLILTPLEIDAMDWMAGKFWIRLGGPAQTVETATARIDSIIGTKPAVVMNSDSENGDDGVWKTANDFSWHDPRQVLIKIPCQLDNVGRIGETANRYQSALRITLGGQLAYASVPVDQVPTFQTELVQQSVPHLPISGPSEINQLVRRQGISRTLGQFSSLIKKAVDPNNHFATL